MKDAIRTIEYKGFTIGVFQDQDAESPREWDNLGVMFCEHNRYTLGDEGAENPFIEDEATGKFKLRSDIVAALPLYLIDHSGLAMRTHNYSDVDSQQWDSGQVGLIYVTREKALKEYGGKRVTKKTLETIRQVLIGEVKTYSDFLEGNVYGFSVEDADGNHIDSCWGFFPDTVKGAWSQDAELQYMLDQAREAVDAELITAKESHTIQAL